MKTDILGRLIGALNSMDVRSFRSSLFLTRGKWAPQRTLLFNTLVADPRCTMAQQQALFSGSAYLKVLVKERYRMYGELLAFLIDLRKRSTDAPDPWPPYEQARLLQSNGLFDLAVESARQGISVAEQVHDLHAQLLLRELLRSIYKLMPRAALSTEITDNEYRLETVARQVTNLTRYNIISDRLFDLHRKYRLADDISVRSAMDALMADELLADMAHAISVPAQIRHRHIWSYYHELCGNLPEALQHLVHCQALWESSPHRIAYLPHLYRETLANLIGLHTVMGQMDRVPPLLTRMEQIPVSGLRDEMLAFCDTELQYQLFYMNTGRLDDVVAREQQVLLGLTRFAAHITESKELTLLYNLGIAHLFVGNDRDALRCFNRIYAKGALASRIDLQSIARIFRLLLLLEKDDTDSFSYHLRSNRRTFSKHMPTYRMMEVVYAWLAEHQNDYHSPDRPSHLARLDASLLPFEQQRVVGAEEMRLWAKSRASGRSMRQLLEEAMAR